MARRNRAGHAGQTILERCLVKVERIQGDDGVTQELQAALTTEARFWAGQTGRFSLAPEEKKRILFVVRDASNPRNPGGHDISFERHSYRIHRGRVCIVELIAVADTGPADRLRLRLAVGKDYALTYEVMPRDDAGLTQSAASATGSSQLIAIRASEADVARSLVSLVEEGVRERNRLNSPVDEFDHEAERQRIVDWSNRVVEKLETEFVTEGERSRFKTLGEYEPKPMGTGNISPQQIHVQTMWTEKLRRLRLIVDRLG